MKRYMLVAFRYSNGSLTPFVSELFSIACLYSGKLQLGWGGGLKICEKINRNRNHFVIDALNRSLLEQVVGAALKIFKMTQLVKNIISSSVSNRFRFFDVTCVALWMRKWIFQKRKKNYLWYDDL